MFLSDFCEILKKSGEYLVQIFRHSERKFCDIFMSILGKTCKKLSEKHEIVLRKFWNNLEKLLNNYFRYILKIFGKMRTHNFELFAENFEEMLEIWRKFLRNFGLAT